MTPKFGTRKASDACDRRSMGASRGRSRRASLFAALKLGLKPRCADTGSAATGAGVMTIYAVLFSR